MTEEYPELKGKPQEFTETWEKEETPTQLKYSPEESKIEQRQKGMTWEDENEQGPYWKRGETQGEHPSITKTKTNLTKEDKELGISETDAALKAYQESRPTETSIKRITELTKKPQKQRKIPSELQEYLETIYTPQELEENSQKWQKNIEQKKKDAKRINKIKRELLDDIENQPNWQKQKMLQRTQEAIDKYYEDTRQLNPEIKEKAEDFLRKNQNRSPGSHIITELTKKPQKQRKIPSELQEYLETIYTPQELEEYYIAQGDGKGNCEKKEISLDPMGRTRH